MDLDEQLRDQLRELAQDNRQALEQLHQIRRRLGDVVVKLGLAHELARRNAIAAELRLRTLEP